MIKRRNLFRFGLGAAVAVALPRGASAVAALPSGLPVEIVDDAAEVDRRFREEVEAVDWAADRDLQFDLLCKRAEALGLRVTRSPGSVTIDSKTITIIYAPETNTGPELFSIVGRDINAGMMSILFTMLTRTLKPA